MYLQLSSRGKKERVQAVCRVCRVTGRFKTSHYWAAPKPCER
jgi:hypothetical protein